MLGRTKKQKQKINLKITEVWTFQINLYFFIHFEFTLCKTNFFLFESISIIWENGWNRVLSTLRGDNWNAIGKVQIIDRKKKLLQITAKLYVNLQLVIGQMLCIERLVQQTTNRKMAICSVTHKCGEYVFRLICVIVYFFVSIFTL